MVKSTQNASRDERNGTTTGPYSMSSSEGAAAHLCRSTDTTEREGSTPELLQRLFCNRQLIGAKNDSAIVGDGHKFPRVLEFQALAQTLIEQVVLFVTSPDPLAQLLGQFGFTC